MLFRDSSQGSKFSDTCIGEDDVNFPFCFDGFAETIKIGQLGNVSLNASDVATDRLHGLVEFLLTTARDKYVSPFFDEELCGSQPYPAGATGNDCQFPF